MIMENSLQTILEPLEGIGDYLTLKCGVLVRLLSLSNEFGLINIK